MRLPGGGLFLGAFPLWQGKTGGAGAGAETAAFCGILAAFAGMKTGIRPMDALAGRKGSIFVRMIAFFPSLWYYFII